MRHLFERGRNQSGQADDIDLFLLGHFQNFLGRHHNPEIDHLVIVTLQDNADNVLADIMHIAFDGGHQHFACKTAGPFLAACRQPFGFHIRQQTGHGLFHDAGGFDHLRQKHFSSPEQIPHLVHTGHQRPFDHLQRAAHGKAGFLDIVIDEIGQAIDQRIRQTLRNRPLPPCEINLCLLPLSGAAEFFRNFQ